MFDLDSILDTPVDDIPSMGEAPEGTTICTVLSWEKKLLTTNDFLIIKFKLVQSIEQVGEVVVANNSEFDLLWLLTQTENMTTHPVVYINTLLRDVNKEFQQEKISGILNQLVGKDVALLTYKDKGGYMKVKKMALA